MNIQQLRDAIENLRRACVADSLRPNRIRYDIRRRARRRSRR